MKGGSKGQDLSQYTGPISVPLFSSLPKGVSELLIPNGLWSYMGKLGLTHAWAATENVTPIRVPGRFSRFTTMIL